MWLIIFVILLTVTVIDVFQCLNHKPVVSIQFVLYMSHSTISDAPEGYFMFSITSIFTILSSLPIIYKYSLAANNCLRVTHKIKNKLRASIVINTLVSIVAGIATIILLQFVSTECAAYGAVCIIISGLLTTTISVFTWQSAGRLFESQMQFHNFITTYRQTPLSKI